MINIQIEKGCTTTMDVFISRFTPNLENGEQVKFNVGERVLYKPRYGPAIDVTIDSEYCEHASNVCGYEAIFSNDGNRYFILSKGIIDWEGKN